MYLLLVLGFVLILTRGENILLNPRQKGIEPIWHSRKEAESAVPPQDWKQTPSRSQSVKFGVKRKSVNSSPCIDGSFVKPVYRLSEFQFNETSTSTSPTELGLTHFQLQDAANNNSFSCTTPYLQDTNVPEWNDCYPSDDTTSPRTIFQHVLSDHKISVNQMWLCEHQNTSFPYLFFSSATLNYTDSLECDIINSTIGHKNCVIKDTQQSPFSGEYVTPDFSSGPKIIQPGPVPANASDDPPWNETPCVGLSFTYPNWGLDNFTYVPGEDGKGVAVSFLLRNHATNATTACAFQQDLSDESQWFECGNTTEIQFNRQEQQLAVSQTWNCSIKDFSLPVTFRAIGHANITVDCEHGSDSCVIANSTIKGSLTEPIELTPNVAPEGVNYPTCLESSNSPTWEISQLVWHQKFDENSNVGDVTVIFRNTANNVTKSCNAQGEELNAIGSNDHERWWGCALPDEAFPQYQIYSKIRLNPVTLEFTVGQTWYCNGNTDSPPAKYVAEGSVQLPLSCSWTNSSSVPNSGKDTACPISNTIGWSCTQTCLLESSVFTTNSNVTSRTDLSPSEFAEPTPSGYSCTIASVLAPKWRVGWNTLTPFWNPTFSNDVETELSLSINNYVASTELDYTSAQMTPFLPTSNAGRWLDCPVASVVGSSNNVNYCKWQFDLATGYFAINQTWTCDDKDPENPIVFTGTGSRFYNFSCYVGHDVRSVTCEPAFFSPPILPSTFSWSTL